MHSLKSTYASAMRGLGSTLTEARLLGDSERPPRSDLALWFHSLFAIYEVDAMTRLDLPWWTLKSTRLIDRFLAARPQARVFEYGAGASTIFLAKRAGHVTTVEHDAYWHSHLARKTAHHSNIHLRLVPAVVNEPETAYRSQHAGWREHGFRNYVHAIDSEDEPFDLIVIDGRCRSRCLEVAQPHLKADGLILFDNAGRRRYRAAINGGGLARLATKGLTACLPYPDQTLLLAPQAATLAALVDH